MAKNEGRPRQPKPPVTRFADGLASGKYVLVTDRQEVAKLLEGQRGGRGSSTSCYDQSYTVEI